MSKRNVNRSKYRGTGICLEKEKPEEKVAKVIVPPGVKVQRIPGISREEYFGGANFYHRKSQRTF